MHQDRIQPASRVRMQESRQSLGEDRGAVFFFEVLRNRRMLILAASFMGLVLGAMVLAIAPRGYRASASVLVDFKRLAPVDQDFSNGAGRIDASVVQSQITVIRSDSVLRRAIEAEKLHEDPEFNGESPLLTRLNALLRFGDGGNLVDDGRMQLAMEALTAHLEVDRIDVSYAIYLAVTASTADKSARIANAIAAAYIADQLDAKRVASTQASQWFSSRLADIQKDVIAADGAVVRYRMSHNIVLADGKFIDEEQVNNLSEKLADARLQRGEAAAKVARLTTIVETGNLQGGLVDEFTNQIIIALRTKYLDTQRLIAELTVRSGANHESVVKMRAQLGELQKSILDEFKRIRDGSKSDLEIAKSREATLEAELTELGSRSSTAQEARIQLQQLQSVADSVKTIRDAFMEKYLEEVNKQSFPMTEARVISEARPPSQPTFPRTTRSLLGGAILGFGAGFFAAIVLEAFSRRLRTRRQIEAATDVPCLGFLPTIDPTETTAAVAAARLQAGRPGIELPREFAVVMHAPSSVFAETLRRIKFAADEYRPPRGGLVIGVVSALPGEGASLVAANLAVLCARAGHRALLVDADLRRASLTRRLGADDGIGLQDLVSTPEFQASAFRAAAGLPLSILTTGPGRPMEPAEVLASSGMQRCFAEFRQRFDTVIVDLPPIAITSDARSLAEFVDRFLLVARWRQADASLILEALRLNRPVQEKLFASVLNQAELAELRPEDGSFGSYAAYFDQTRQTANPSAAASVFTAPHATQQVTRREKVLPFK